MSNGGEEGCKNVKRGGSAASCGVHDDISACRMRIEPGDDGEYRQLGLQT